MTKAQIKSTGKIVEVTSRFMPKKRNAPSREWMCNLSDGTCINESELEYLKDSLQDELDKEASEYADKHYSEWEEHWDDYNGYNAEPENDKLQLIDAFKAGAEWQKVKMLKDAVEGYVNYYEDSGGILMAEAQVGCPYHNGDKVRIVVLKAEGCDCI